jgi:hypothetical protein
MVRRSLHSHCFMNKLQREQAATEWQVDGRRARRMATLLALGALSCLPTDDLSSYSNGKRPIEPIEMEPIESVPGDPLAEAPPVTRETALPADPAPSAATDCGSECSAPALSMGSDQQNAALGATSPGAASNQVPSGADAGVAASTADAGASILDEAAVRCVPGSIVGPEQRCFELVRTTSSWADARTRCQNNGPGWDLTTIHGETRNAWLSSLLGSVTDAWVGASDTQTEGLWRWLGDSAAFWNGPATGSAVGNAYENWSDGAPAEPNGGDTSDCLRLRAGGAWADFQCATAYASICEGPQG